MFAGFLKLLRVDLLQCLYILFGGLFELFFMLCPRLFELPGVILALLDQIRHFSVVLGKKCSSAFSISLVSQFFDLCLSFLSL